LAVVLDNSLSSGVVLDDERALDRLKRAALESVARATDQDRIWIVRVGEPWGVAAPGGPEDARARVAATELSEGQGDVLSAIDRSLALVAASDLPAREVHVISDLQATGFPDSVLIDQGPGTPVLIWTPSWDQPPNGTVSELQIGAGLPPLAGQRTEVVATLAGPPDSQDTISVRLWLDESVRGATAAPPGSSVLFPIPAVGGDRLAGYVERDPDALRSDDRRYFSVPVQAAPRIRLSAGAPAFLDEAITVLEESGRGTRAPGPADVVVSIGGDGLGAGAQGASWIVFPPTDPNLLPALNSRLAAAGIPWRYERVLDEGERAIEESALPHVREEVRVYRRYGLTTTDASRGASQGTSPGASPGTSPGQPTGGAAANGRASVDASLEGGDPWVVSGRTDQGRYLLNGSPVDPAWSNLPVSSAMVPVLEWMVTTWAGTAAAGIDLRVGDVWMAPDTVTAVADPDGTLVPMAEDRRFRVERAGLYRLMANAEPFATIAVNAPPEESDLRRVDADALEARSDLNAEVVSSGGWSGEVFRSRQGPEIWRPLLFALIVVLIVESMIAASGVTEEQPLPGPTPRPA